MSDTFSEAPLSAPSTRRLGRIGRSLLDLGARRLDPTFAGLCQFLPATDDASANRAGLTANDHVEQCSITVLENLGVYNEVVPQENGRDYEDHPITAQPAARCHRALCRRVGTGLYLADSNERFRRPFQAVFRGLAPGDSPRRLFERVEMSLKHDVAAKPAVSQRKGIRWAC